MLLLLLLFVTAAAVVGLVVFVVCVHVSVCVAAYLIVCRSVFLYLVVTMTISLSGSHENVRPCVVYILMCVYSTQFAWVYRMFLHLLSDIDWENEEGEPIIPLVSVEACAP